MMHQPHTQIAAGLSNSSPGLGPSWNPPSTMNMSMAGNQGQWDYHQSRPAFGAYDYHRSAPYPAQNFALGGHLSQGIPVAPGLPEHLTRPQPHSHSPHSMPAQPSQSVYNKDFPPLA
jgi:hypothetical protein